MPVDYRFYATLAVSSVNRTLPRIAAPLVGIGPSSTRLKENPRNITSITDRTRDGLKIALEQMNATAIGKATAKLLEWLSVPP